MNKLYQFLIMISAITMVSCNVDTRECESNNQCALDQLCVGYSCVKLKSVEIVTDTINSAVLGQPYETIVEVKYGVFPFRWSIDNKPYWLSIESIGTNTAKISGIPEDIYEETIPVIVRVQDATIGRDNFNISNFTLQIGFCKAGDIDLCYEAGEDKCQVGERPCINGDWGPCQNFAGSTDIEYCGPSCDGCLEASEACVDGVCASCGDIGEICTAQESCCYGACVDLSSSNENCGECGNDCTNLSANVINPHCSESNCVYDSCIDTYLDCDDLVPGCESNIADPEHCGSCDNDCTQDPQGHVCIDTDNQPKCGCEIDQDCDPGQVCQNNACIEPTPTPTPEPTPTPTPTPTPGAPVPKTGQTTSYATGDDGYYQAGLTLPSPRFTDNNDGTVKDNLTGLIWLKNANCVELVAEWATALVKCNNLKSGQCGLTDESVTGDWRLPNINELMSLFYYDIAWPYQPFTNIKYHYWSGTTPAWTTSNVYTAKFLGALVQEKDKVLNPDLDICTWAVRNGNNVPTPSAPVAKTGQTTSYANGDDGFYEAGVAFPSPRFTDNNDGTVRDNLTGLIWLKNANCFGSVDWATALDKCNNLKSGQCSLTDGSVAGEWRLPNIKELKSLVDHGEYSPALPSAQPFLNVMTNDNYFSSTSALINTASALGVDPINGTAGPTSKTSTNIVWPVRGN